jgi:hypothetical protein
VAGNRGQGELLVAQSTVSAQSLLSVSLLPISLYCFQPEMTGWVVEYGEQRVQLELAGAGAELRNTAGGDTHLSPGSIVQGHLRLSSGEYLIAPRSKHSVVFQDADLPPEERVVRANGAGELRLDFTGSQMKFIITPVEDPGDDVASGEES